MSGDEIKKINKRHGIKMCTTWVIAYGICPFLARSCQLENTACGNPRIDLRNNISLARVIGRFPSSTQRNPVF